MMRIRREFRDGLVPVKPLGAPRAGPVSTASVETLCSLCILEISNALWGSWKTGSKVVNFDKLFLRGFWPNSSSPLQLPHSAMEKFSSYTIQHILSGPMRIEMQQKTEPRQIGPVVVVVGRAQLWFDISELAAAIARLSFSLSQIKSGSDELSTLSTCCHWIRYQLSEAWDALHGRQPAHESWLLSKADNDRPAEGGSIWL